MNAAARAAAQSTLPPAPEGIGAADWATRCELAALYRLVAHVRMTDLITHRTSVSTALKTDALPNWLAPATPCATM